MALRKVKACVLAPFLLLAGCSAFFGFNALKGLDKVAAPNPSQYDYYTSGPAGLNKLGSDLGSAAIIAALTADPTATATIESNLQTTYTDPSVPLADQQQAAALYSDLNLKTTSGDQFVNNVVNIVVSGTGSGQTIQQILQGIVPANVASDPVAFAAMVTGLVNAAAAYQVLGATVPPAPAGVNMGDVAQKAAVAYMMQSVIYEIGGGTANATTQMFNLLNNQPNTVPSSPIDPFSTPIAPYNGTNLTNIQNIFTAAGATMPS